MFGLWNSSLIANNGDAGTFTAVPVTIVHPLAERMKIVFLQDKEFYLESMKRIEKIWAYGVLITDIVRGIKNIEGTRSVSLLTWTQLNTLYTQKLHEKCDHSKSVAGVFAKIVDKDSHVDLIIEALKGMKDCKHTNVTKGVADILRELFSKCAHLPTHLTREEFSTFAENGIKSLSSLNSPREDESAARSLKAAFEGLRVLCKDRTSFDESKNAGEFVGKLKSIAENVRKFELPPTLSPEIMKLLSSYSEQQAALQNLQHDQYEVYGEIFSSFSRDKCVRFFSKGIYVYVNREPQDGDESSIVFNDVAPQPSFGEYDEQSGP